MKRDEGRPEDRDEVKVEDEDEELKKGRRRGDEVLTGRRIRVGLVRMTFGSGTGLKRVTMMIEFVLGGSLLGLERVVGHGKGIHRTFNGIGVSRLGV